MEDKVQFCKVCKENNIPPKCPGFLTYYDIFLDECPYDHNKDLITYNISRDDFHIIWKISSDIAFLEAMIALKESAPIEYNLKMAQFKTQLEQRESLNKQKEAEDNKPKCPICGSTSITTGARGVNFMWGLIGASKTVNRCASCGHTWKP